MGYHHVYTPHLASVELYKTSGHWDHYRDDMYPPMNIDHEELVLRPMNCPHHMMIYRNELRSYRDLPLRIAELGTMHRYEMSGALAGLQRVRAMTLNDAHIFCRPEQLKSEFKRVVELIQHVYRDFGIEDYYFRLSYRDPEDTEKYVQNDDMWEKAQTTLKETMDEMDLEYVEAEGEAAFYGPKLDVQVRTALGKDETLSTVQLDFHFPDKFRFGVYRGRRTSSQAGCYTPGRRQYDGAVCRLSPRILCGKPSGVAVARASADHTGRRSVFGLRAGSRIGFAI